MKDDSELVKEVLKVLQPLVAEESSTFTGRRAAFAIARAYRNGYFTVPVEQLTDKDLLVICNFGPKLLAKVREIVPRPERNA